METESKIDLTKAVLQVKKYLNSLQNQLSQSIQDVRLEEIELSEDESFWLITLSFLSLISKEANPLGDLTPIPQYERVDKVFKVDAKNGKVLSMKIRNL